MLLLPYSALPESLPPFRPSSRIAVRISCRSPRCQARIPAVNINKTGSPSSSLHKQTHHRIISITAGQPKQPEKPRQLPSLRSLGNIKKKLTSVPFSPRHLLRAPRHIGIFFAPFSPYLPLAAAFRIISPFCCKKNRDFADLTLDKRDSADYLFKRLQFFAGLYYV